MVVWKGGRWMCGGLKGWEVDVWWSERVGGGCVVVWKGGRWMCGGLKGWEVGVWWSGKVGGGCVVVFCELLNYSHQLRASFNST